MASSRSPPAGEDPTTATPARGLASLAADADAHDRRADYLRALRRAYLALGHGGAAP